MEIDGKYQIWMLDSGDTRPILQYAKVERLGDGKEGRIIATDGFMAVFIPCTLDDSDVPGLVLMEHLKDAWNINKKRNTVIYLKEGEVTYWGITQNRYKVNSDKDANYPDVDQVIPTSRAGQIGVFSFNPFLMVDLSKALGCDKKNYKALVITATAYKYENMKMPHPKPFLVETQPPDDDNKPVIPFGILMSMAVTNVEYKKILDEKWK